MFKTTDFNSHYKQCNKKIKYSIVISIILHIIICIGLCKKILFKESNHDIAPITMLESKLTNLHNNRHSTDTTADRLQITAPQHKQSISTGKNHNIPAISSKKHSTDTTADHLQTTAPQHKQSISTGKNHNIPAISSKKHSTDITADHLQTTAPQKNTKHTQSKIHTNSENNNDNLKNLLNILINNTDQALNQTQIKLNISKTNDFKYIPNNNNTKNKEIDLYKNMISQAIQCKFYNSSDYSGQECSLKIQLSPDGKLISIDPISGNTALCQAAIIAVKLANLPTPPNMHIYKIFKKIILNFSP